MKRFMIKDPKSLTKEQGDRGMAIKPTIQMVKKVQPQKNSGFLTVERDQLQKALEKGYGCWDSHRQHRKGRGICKMGSFYIRRIGKNTKIEKVDRITGDALIASGQAKPVPRREVKKTSRLITAPAKPVQPGNLGNMLNDFHDNLVYRFEK